MTSKISNHRLILLLKVRAGHASGTKYPRDELLLGVNQFVDFC